jgi:mannan endo-1,4-beta-mannosidase
MSLLSDFQHLPKKVLANGQATINTGSNGLQRLDQVVNYAEKYGIKLLLTLTNNWNPEHQIASNAIGRRWDPACLPRGTLSNDYGMSFLFPLFFFSP